MYTCRSSAPQMDCKTFEKLYSWKNGSRQRRRLVLNPFGSSHAEALLHSPPPISLAQPPNTANTANLNQFNRNSLMIQRLLR
nr:hypothetical transcript [Hymenolepis microstoma]